MLPPEVANMAMNHADLAHRKLFGPGELAVLDLTSFSFYRIVQHRIF